MPTGYATYRTVCIENDHWNATSHEISPDSSCEEDEIRLISGKNQVREWYAMSVPQGKNERTDGALLLAYQSDTSP